MPKKAYHEVCSRAQLASSVASSVANVPSLSQHGQVQYGGLCCMPFHGTTVCGKSESYICPVRSVDICGNLPGNI